MTKQMTTVLTGSLRVKPLESFWVSFLYFVRLSWGRLPYSNSPLNLFPTLSVLQTKTYTCANSANPDEIVRNKPPHQDLHCLPFCFFFNLDWKLLFASRDMFKFKHERIHFINWWIKRLSTPASEFHQYCHFYHFQGFSAVVFG